MIDGEGGVAYLMHIVKGNPTNMEMLLRVHECPNCKFKMGIDLSREGKWIAAVTIPCPSCGTTIYQGGEVLHIITSPDHIADHTDFRVYTYRSSDYETPLDAMEADAVHTTGDTYQGRSVAWDIWTTVHSALACTGMGDQVTLFFVEE